MPKTPLRIILAVLTLASTASGSAAESVPPEFGRDVQLAPLVIRGKPLTISVHARSKGDRRYAEKFAEEVVKVVYESVTEETGKGLVIIGKKGEPHPVFVFRRFLALAEAGKLDTAVAARGAELTTMLDHWRDEIGDGQAAAAGGEKEVDPEFETIIRALPLPLEGVGAQLYQLAWREGFDDAKVDAKLRALQPSDLEGTNFGRFDWVFYLPARGAFEQAIDALVADALKEEGAGFITRTFVKGVMLTVKPAIRRAIESVRRGVLFATVVGAGSDFSDEQVEALTRVYIRTLNGKEEGKAGAEFASTVEALRAERPVVVPTPEVAAPEL